jgi:hypothetical protein
MKIRGTDVHELPLHTLSYHACRVIFSSRHPPPAALLEPEVQRGRGDVHSQAHLRAPPERGSSSVEGALWAPSTLFTSPALPYAAGQSKGGKPPPKESLRKHKEVCCGCFGSRCRNSLDRCISLDRSRAVVCPFGPVSAALDTLGLGAEEQTAKLELMDRHRSMLQQSLLEEQVSRLVEPFAIPEEWYELTLAYYLSDKGMSDFELRGYNLRQELARQRELFKRGHITQAEYEQAFLFIDRQLQKLKPSAQPEAREILPLLKDFPALWRQMTLTERRAILQSMFAGLYFDSQCQLRKVSAHSPFDELMGLVQDASIPIELLQLQEVA